MKHMIAWTEFNRGGAEMRHAEPKDMTKRECDACDEVIL